MNSASFRHLRFESIDSTNAQARRLSENGESGPLWITADTQTAGRGRRGRDWVSKSGNLFATHLLTVPVEPATATQISFVTALALYDACMSFLPSTIDLSLKWPNDLLLEQKKLAGILLETVPCKEPGRLGLAIGCGVNLDHAPEQTAYAATWLNAHTQDKISPTQFLPVFAAAMNTRLDLWRNGESFDLIAKAWQNRASHIGKMVSLTTANETIVGKFLALAVDGALILELNDGKQQHFHAGDVSLRPHSTTRSSDAE